MKELEKYSFGVGDRFAHQATAQLAAFVAAEKLGIDLVPVWNKSNREHSTIGSQPNSVRVAAEAAVAELGWKKSYYVDADHINLTTVDRFLAASDFYTIDVADAIGRRAKEKDVRDFVASHDELIGDVEIPGIAGLFHMTPQKVTEIAAKYLLAVQQAGTIYRHIHKKKGPAFVAEVSMDETDTPQTPPELLVILAALADEEIKLQTIAPKFTGRFNKGVDYVGNLEQFATEFRQDLAVLAFASQQYGLPANLKLSVHSGSDKFSIYGPMRCALQQFNAGVHIKTAGTTWLEELIGLAEAGGDGLQLAKEIYAEALAHRVALCAPYESVIDVNPACLPAAAEVHSWSSTQYVNALRHDPRCPEFNSHFRQLLHVAYKVAAQMGVRYLTMLRECAEPIARNVTENLLERHMKPLFGSATREDQ